MDKENIEQILNQAERLNNVEDSAKATQYFLNLVKEVTKVSESQTWELAVKEWEIIDCEIDVSLSKSCVCGKDRLKYLFTIKNVKNGNVLYPIGSSCIKQFNRDELDYEISVYEDMFKLIHAYKNKEYIELNSKFFTRNLLEYLYRNDVFQPNKFNGFDAEEDYWFMLEMFNKRNKEDIEESQQRKIKAIILNSIFPFIQQKIKYKEEKQEVKKCPKCGGDMLKRTAKNGSNAGVVFWVCKNFPNCRYTENLKNN